ncbi:hypothetical protein [Rosenbergiella epipactidis]|uniref:hypothetical protein n=1 Tax=Rosenbergiella epipactidis TaxID=1544694 RepID=UPI001F4EBC62|nr:hypothetical protein [Rosenbergiella epipactidis]
MPGQSKANIFGCSSKHKISMNQPKTNLTPDQFLELKETQDYIKLHPDSVSIGDNGEVFCNDDLSMRYLHLLGNKKVKKALRKALESR